MVLFFPPVFCFRLGKCVLHSYLRVSAMTINSFRSQKAERSLFEGKDGKSITTICGALMWAGAKIIPIGVTGQEASHQEMDLHVTVLQIATGLLSSLTETQQVQGHWVCNHSLEISPVPSFSLSRGCLPHLGCSTSTTQSLWSYVDSIGAHYSPTHCLRNQMFSSVTLWVWEMTAGSQGDRGLSGPP